MENQIEQDCEKQFGRLVRYWMRKRGFTRGEFGKRIGYSPGKLSEILYGQATPTRAEKEKFAVALGLQLDCRQDGGRSYVGGQISNLSDQELASLFLDSVPEDEPKLPYLHKF